MRRIMVGAALAAVAFSLGGAPAQAREDFCLNADKSVNRTATRGYRAIENNRNQTLMRRIHGVWFSQTRNGFTGQISYLWEFYEGRGRRAGLYSYCNIVCDQNNRFCSRPYQGVGLWAVRGRATNINGMRIVSDLERDHFCQILRGRLSDGNGVWTAPGGAQTFRGSASPSCPPPP